VFLFYLGAANLFGAVTENLFKSALALYLDNHYYAAINYLNTIVKTNDTSWKAHQLLGYCDYMVDQKPNALKECKKSLKLHGDNPRLQVFVDSLKEKLTGKKSKRRKVALVEGKDEAQMPMPPDQDPDRKPDNFI
jgi:tetratricopeptide (TPR) repeat protein